jgi:hypothetical protein
VATNRCLATNSLRWIQSNQSRPSRALSNSKSPACAWRAAARIRSQRPPERRDRDEDDEEPRVAGREPPASLQRRPAVSWSACSASR